MRNGEPTHQSGSLPSALEVSLWVLFLFLCYPGVFLLLGRWLVTDMDAGSFQAIVLGVFSVQSIALFRLVRVSGRFKVAAVILLGLLVAGAMFISLAALWFSTDEKPLVNTVHPHSSLAVMDHVSAAYPFWNSIEASSPCHA